MGLDARGAMVWDVGEELIRDGVTLLEISECVYGRGNVLSLDGDAVVWLVLLVIVELAPLARRRIIGCLAAFRCILEKVELHGEAFLWSRRLARFR